jgi:hypothetical protein
MEVGMGRAVVAARHQAAEARQLWSDDDPVEPVTPSGERDTDDSAWDFSSRQQAGRNSAAFRNSQVHSQPTRHASLDAGYLQQRVYAASQVLDKSVGADRGQADGLSAFKGGTAHSPGSATANEGIEIAWVSVLCRCSQSCTCVGLLQFAVPLLLIQLQ